ncbi:MAG: hypothetical protein NTY03_08670 [Candidatus Bathyarchaeota archaeon]|nr:hypothetical protein [Candidatus Bathyarchaeota archaeon]
MVGYPTPGNGGTEIPSGGVSINMGATTAFNIYCRQGGLSQPFSELVGRQTLLIKFVTAEGLEYVKICELCPLSLKRTPKRLMLPNSICLRATVCPER